jgi:methionyl-tRNA formyltransferase
MFRIVFFGTSEFAVPSLRALAADPRFSVIAIVTQPDRPVGRHATITPPAVKTALSVIPDAAERRSGIPIFQPEKLKELQTNPDFQSLVQDPPDAFVVVSYGKILPPWLLDIPKQGCLNVHGSVLPRWRGPSPIHAAIVAGDEKSGVTIMKLDAEMDHGPILGITEEPIRLDDTAGSLHDRLADLGGHVLPDTLADYLDGKLQPIEQDHPAATYCKILTRDDGKIDWTKPAIEIERMVRGLYPWPGTWFMHDEKRMKVLDAKLGDATNEIPGTVFQTNKQVFVACGDKTSLELVTIQPEGKKAMNANTFTWNQPSKP